MDREELHADLMTRKELKAALHAFADLIDQQAARIAELEALLKKTDEGLEAEAGKRLKAEARADAAWCAGRDAAAIMVERYDNDWSDYLDISLRTLIDTIRALNPPEDKP